MPDEMNELTTLTKGLLQPTELKRELRQRLQAAYASLYAQRGEVHTPEDVNDMVRRLAGVRELFEGYRDAFKEVAALAGTLMAEELVEAVGEQDGVPNQGMTVPDAQGDIRLKLDKTTSHEIQLDQLLGVLMLEASDRMTELTGVRTPPHLEAHLQSLITFVFEVIQSWGKVTVQVSKVRAYGKELARRGQDSRAAQVNGAIVTTSEFKGVGFERKTS